MPKKAASVLIRNGTILTLDSDRRTLENGTVAITGDRIDDIGPDIEISKKWEAQREIEATGKAVLPGFINTHTHATHNLLRGGLSQDRNLYDWLLNVLYAGLAQYTGADARTAAKLYCIEAIRSGITTSVDNADWGMVDELAENTIEVYQEYGIRAIYARMFSDKDPKSEDALRKHLKERNLE
jgi:cytosine/adenosine deaminase-related metal-dependent hydrolase